MDRIEELRAMVAAATPGPWFEEIEADPEGDGPRVFICHKGTVCDVTTVCNLEHSEGAPLAKRQATARLIAAAPTLAADLASALEEVERLRAALTRINDNGALLLAHLSSELIDKARAALAPASGAGGGEAGE